MEVAKSLGAKSTIAVTLGIAELGMERRESTKLREPAPIQTLHEIHWKHSLSIPVVIPQETTHIEKSMVSGAQSTPSLHMKPHTAVTLAVATCCCWVGRAHQIVLEHSAGSTLRARFGVYLLHRH